MFLNKSVLKRKKGRRPDEEKVISSYVWQKWRRGISKRSCQMLTDEEEEGGGIWHEDGYCENTCKTLNELFSITQNKPTYAVYYSVC